MMKDQAVVAFISSLVQDHGVPPETIESAVNAVLDIKLGESITKDNQLVRAFAMEQRHRLAQGR